MMTPEENKAILRRFIEEIYNQKHVAAYDDYTAPGFYSHMSGGMTREQVRQSYAGIFAGLPDLHYQIEDVIAEGDKVAVRLTVTGTHLGQFWGFPPTGKRVKMTAIHIGRMVDGKFVEHWAEADALGMRQQLAAAEPQEVGV
jgi:predicted ester cyclase